VSVRLVAWLNDLSATVHIVGVAMLVVLLFAVGPAHGPSWLFKTGITTRPDGDYALGFASSLLLGMWTFTGFDASAHVSEETHDPRRRAPIGIVSSVAVSAVVGYALVCALTLAMSDPIAAAADPQSALFVMRGALGGAWGSRAMGLAIAAMWFCGLSSVTSASRTLYAFARDGGLPGSAAIRRVSPRLKTPPVAIAIAVGAPLALVAVTRAASDQHFDEIFVQIASLATTGLYVSYATPIALGALARRSGAWRTRGPWNLGRFGVAVACLAVLWTFVVLAVCALPPNTLGGELLAGVIAALSVLYFSWVRGRFQGPRVRLADLEASDS
jgi:amino acid transporter